MTAAITLPEDGKDDAAEAFQTLRRLATDLGAGTKVGPGVAKVWICFVFWMAARPGGAGRWIAWGLGTFPFRLVHGDRPISERASRLADAFDRHAIAKLQGIGVAEAEAALATSWPCWRGCIAVTRKLWPRSLKPRWMKLRSIGCCRSTTPPGLGWALVPCGVKHCGLPAPFKIKRWLIRPEFTCGLGESTAATGSGGG